MIIYVLGEVNEAPPKGCDRIAELDEERRNALPANSDRSVEMEKKPRYVLF